MPHPFELSDLVSKSSPPLNSLVPNADWLQVRLLIGGFFFYSTLLPKVPADPPMGFSGYRLDQASALLGAC